MKILFLISFSLLLGFVGQDVFAETEMTGWLGIMDSYSTEGGPHPYLFWFQPDDQTAPYRLNPYTLPSNILDLAGEKVRITVDDGEDVPLASSLNPMEQFLDIVSIEVIEIPEGILSTNIPPTTVRSVTLLSKFNDVAVIPSETAGTSPGQFLDPQGVAVDVSGNIFVADSVNHRIQKFDSSGDFLLKIGSNPFGGSEDGEFAFPTGVAVDSLGNIYVVDNNNHRVQKFDSSGVFLLKFGSRCNLLTDQVGCVDPDGAGPLGLGDGQFRFPFGIEVDSSGNSYVVDVSNHRIQKFDSSGTFQGWMGKCTSGSNCNIPSEKSKGFSCTANTCSGLACSAGVGTFCSPNDVAIDISDNIYIAGDTKRCINN